jgi:hypothetical protein
MMMRPLNSSPTWSFGSKRRGAEPTCERLVFLVLGRYVGLVCGLFAVALACATAFAFLFLYVSLPNISLPNFFHDIYIANDVQGMLFGLAFAALWGGAGAGAWVGAVKGVQALEARIRFSRLLRPAK